MLAIGRYVKIAASFGLLWGLLVVYNNYGCAKIEGTEMQPTMSLHDVKIAHIGFSSLQEFQHGDILSYEIKSLNTTQLIFAGRVIALPGEKVAIREGTPYVNGQKVSEPYIAGGNRSGISTEEIVIPHDHVYLLCDNRQSRSSVDSRTVGPIGRWAIVGKIGN